MYRKVDSSILDALHKIFGEENVVTGADRLEPFGRDETDGLTAAPEAAVRAVSTDQVSQLLRLAGREKIPITPRGAGTGLAGGAVPIHGGIVLSLERMNRIIEIDPDNLMATVEPGVITGDLHRAVEEAGLFYPPDPASLDSCSIGGNVATGAGGPRAVRYGVTADYVRGLEAVLPSGEVIRCGGKTVKNATGYNLAQLLVGSEGTLAVVTRIVLRLLPLPGARLDLLVPFDDIRAAARTITEIIRRRLVPTTIEFLERDSIAASERLLKKTIPFNDAAAHLLIQLDGKNEGEVEKKSGEVGAICMENGARDILVAADRATRERLWETRRTLLDAIRNESSVYKQEDLVVPRAAIPDLLEGLQSLGRSFGLRLINYGHAGDGNVHVNILRDNTSKERWKEAIPPLEEAIYGLTISLGGTITGEHGIGVTRKKFLPAALDAAQIAVMKSVRDVFDPNRILNPGKIFP
jgi:glycolate oxidase